MSLEKGYDSNVLTRKYLDQLMIEQRVIDSVMPSAKTVILGKEFSTPIINSAFSHIEKGHPGYPAEMAKGFRQAEALFLWGMSTDEEMGKIYATGADTVEIIKPYAEEEQIYQRIEFAAAHGAFGVGMDIDHAYGRYGTYDDVGGIKMEPK